MDVLIYTGCSSVTVNSPLTFAGFAIAAQAEPGAAAASPRLVAVPQQTDVGAASGLPKLVLLACVAAH